MERHPLYVEPVGNSVGVRVEKIGSLFPTLKMRAPFQNRKSGMGACMAGYRVWSDTYLNLKKFCEIFCWIFDQFVRNTDS